jgi:hypothetical protein
MLSINNSLEHEKSCGFCAARHLKELKQCLSGKFKTKKVFKIFQKNIFVISSVFYMPPVLGEAGINRR